MKAIKNLRQKLKQLKEQNHKLADADWNNLPRRAVRLICKRRVDIAEENARADGKSFDKAKAAAESMDTPPSDEEIYCAGYNPVSCVSFFTHFRRRFRNNTSKGVLLTFLSIYCISIFVVDYIHHYSLSYYSIYAFLLSVLFSSIIVIYCFIADTYDSKINSMISAFPENENYSYHCKKYYRWVRAPILRDKAKRLENKRSLSFWIWLIFTVIWEFALIALAVFAYTKTRINGITGVLVLLLFFASMSLVGQSYYNCILIVCFYQKLTGLINKNYLLKYCYNKEQPSQTAGFVQHITDVNDNAVTFLSVSILYMLAFAIIIHLRVPRDPIVLSSDWIMLLVFVGVFLYTSASAIIVFYVPKIMLNRALKSWVEQSRKEYQIKLFDCYNSDPKDMNQIEKYNAILKQLSAEHVSYNDSIWSIIASCLGVVSPLITLGATLFAFF